VDNLSWVGTRCDGNQVVTILQRSTASGIDRASRQGLQFDKAKTEPGLCTCRRCHTKPIRAKADTNDEVCKWGHTVQQTSNGLATSWNECTPDVQSAPHPMHEEINGGRSETPNTLKTYGVVPMSMSAAQVARIQRVALYGSVLWWNYNAVGRRDDLQPLLNQQTMSVLGAPPTTPWEALCTESGLIPASVILNSTQQQPQPFLARETNSWSSDLNESYKDPSSGITNILSSQDRTRAQPDNQGMTWLALAEDSVVKTIIVDHQSTNERAGQTMG
jgi:hypothetical protein